MESTTRARSFYLLNLLLIASIEQRYVPRTRPAPNTGSELAAIELLHSDCSSVLLGRQPATRVTASNSCSLAAALMRTQFEVQLFGELQLENLLEILFLWETEKKCSAACDAASKMERPCLCNNQCEWPPPTRKGTLSGRLATGGCRAQGFGCAEKPPLCRLARPSPLPAVKVRAQCRELIKLRQ